MENKNDTIVILTVLSTKVKEMKIITIIDNTYLYYKGVSFRNPCEKFTGWNYSILALYENF